MAAALPPPVTAADRLGFTLFLAIALHAVVILGIDFGLDRERGDEPQPTLDVILVPPVEEPVEPTEPADYLAQAAQAGGGDTPEKIRPKSLPPAPLPSPAPQVALQQREVTAAPPVPEVRRVERSVVTVDEAPERVVAPERDPEPKRDALPLSAAQLIQRSKQIAHLNAEIAQSAQAYAQLPRQRYISAATQEYKYAAYMEAWRAKVESIGNINYPQEAKLNKLSGSLILDVALRPNGSVESCRIRRSSGHKVLDDAAIRIVQLAAPYAPFPHEIREDTDILHIIRTWQFETGGLLSTR